MTAPQWCETRTKKFCDVGSTGSPRHTGNSVESDTNTNMANANPMVISSRRARGDGMANQTRECVRIATTTITTITNKRSGEQEEEGSSSKKSSSRN
jgi:hypothetical protein